MDRLNIVEIDVAEATTERPLLVTNDEDVEDQRHHARIHQERWRQEQPRLTQHAQQRRDVDGIAHPPVGTDSDEASRRVPRAGSATSDDGATVGGLWTESDSRGSASVGPRTATTATPLK